MSGLSAFWGLTRFNLRHLLLSPVFLLVVPLSLVGLFLATHNATLPTWVELHNNARLQALGVATAMFVVTAFPAMREVRHSTGLALALPPRVRLLSLALAAAAVASSLMVLLIGLGMLGAGGSIAGTISPLALVGVVVLACCGPLAAVATTAWTRSHAPLVTLVLLIPAYLLYTLTAMDTRADVVMRQLGGAAGWVLNPMPVNHPAVPEPVLLYLAHATLLAGCLLALAMAARGGARSFRPVAMGIAGVLLSGLLGIGVYAGNAYSYETRFADELLHGGVEADPCRVREGVTYCPLPGYDSWVDYWHAALGPAMAQVPEQERDRLPTVWQSGVILRVDIHPSPPEGTITVPEHWDPEQPYYREDLVGSGTATVVGLTGDPRHACTATGQARMAMGAWMASVDEGLSDAERIDAAEAFLYGFGPARSDVRLAHALVDLPRERVASVVDEHWNTLVSPDTESEELAEMLGLSLSGSAAIPEPDWERSIWHEDAIANGPERSMPRCT